MLYFNWKYYHTQLYRKHGKLKIKYIKINSKAKIIFWFTRQ